MKKNLKIDLSNVFCVFSLEKTKFKNEFPLENGLLNLKTC
jgi:hypothetical protein